MLGRVAVVGVLIALGMGVLSASVHADNQWLTGSQEITVEWPDESEPTVLHAFILDLAPTSDWRVMYVWEEAYRPVWPFARKRTYHDVSLTWYPPAESAYFLTTGRRWSTTGGTTYLILNRPF